MIENLALLPIWYLAFIISITFHEAAHALVGFKLGDKTAEASGQVTLNPFPHIKREFVGTVFVPLFSYLIGGWMLGWASAPYNVYWAKSNPKKLAWMSIAGPAANLLIVLIILLLTNLGYYFDILYAPESINFTHITDSNVSEFLSRLSGFISILFSLNIMLFVFNLLPLPILDGSKIPLFFIDKKFTGKYIEFVNDPRLVIPVMFIAWFLFEYIHAPVRSFFINLLYYGVSYG